METKILIILFVSSSMGATFVNKFVLSTLKYTYPTVYQSWQMTVMFISIYSLSCLGFIKLSNIERLAIEKWFPAMCFFTIAIYSGSVALSRLPIPIFATSFHFVYVAYSVADNFMFKKVLGLFSLFGLALGFVGLFFVISIYPFDFLGHKWMFIHCLSSASYMIFVKRIYKGKLRELDKIILNSSFSILTLLLTGIISGEVSRSFNFPYLLSRNFHHGCITSGITGAFLGLSYSRLASLLPVTKLRWISSMTMTITSVISTFIFPIKTSILIVASIATTLTGSVIYTYSVAAEELQHNLRTGDSTDTPIISEP